MDGIVDSTDMRLSKLWEIAKDRDAWWPAVRRVAESRARLSDCATKRIHRFETTKQIVAEQDSGRLDVPGFLGCPVHAAC